MKKILAVLAVALLLGSFVACSKGDGGSSSSSSGSISGGGNAPEIGGGTLIERQSRMMDHMINILEGAGDDPAKAASSLLAYQQKNESAIKQMQTDAEQFKKDIQKDPQKAMGMLKDAQALMQKATKLAGLMEKFQKDPNFMAAISKLKMQ
jgi:hypothetical protein